MLRDPQQADVIHLMFLLDDQFTDRQKEAAFHFYEPLTTHDSSLSYSIHCIAAARLGMTDKAFDYFVKTCRLDLDDEQNTACSGLHGASLGGTWQAAVNGIGGVRIAGGMLSVSPILPQAWQTMSFTIHFQGRIVRVFAEKCKTSITLLQGKPLTILLHGAVLNLE